MLKIFGKLPSGTRLLRIKRSSHYTDGALQNVLPTEVMLKDVSIVKVLKQFLNKPKDNIPSGIIPAVKTDLNALPDDKATVIWFGHSSYLIKIKKKIILVDPVFSGSVSPIKLGGKAFAGSDRFRPADFPELDMVILTHDHYDHLDFKTILELNSKTRHFYTSLGVGSHLEFWGIDPSKITELDWWENLRVDPGTELIATPARHFSGRGIRRFQTLWSSFVLKTGDYSIFIGGDSGYDSSFVTIGEKFGPFDLALLECGQYGDYWPYIHMKPEQTVQAAIDLQAKVLMPVHWAKFSLSYHKWNDPVMRLVKSAQDNHVRITTPLIGEPVVLNEVYPDKEWWNF